MSEPLPAAQYQHREKGDNLPAKALNLARRAKQIANGGDGRHKLELIVVGGRWLLIVNDGQKVEDLGQE